MITINSLDINGIIFVGIHLELPSTNMFIIMNEVGYIISTTFGMRLFNERLKEHQVIAGVVREVESIDEILVAPLVEITDDAIRKGWFVGMKGKEALLNIA